MDPNDFLNYWLNKAVIYLDHISPNLSNAFIAAFEYIGKKYDLWIPVDKIDESWGSDHQLNKSGGNNNGKKTRI